MFHWLRWRSAHDTPALPPLHPRHPPLTRCVENSSVGWLCCTVCVLGACLLCCCFIYQTVARGSSPPAAATASAPSSAPNSDNDSWSLYTLTLNTRVTAFELWRFLAKSNPHKPLPHPHATWGSLRSWERISKAVGGGLWSVATLSTESWLQGWSSVSFVYVTGSKHVHVTLQSNPVTSRLV